MMSPQPRQMTAPSAMNARMRLRRGLRIRLAPKVVGHRRNLQRPGEAPKAVWAHQPPVRHDSQARRNPQKVAASTRSVSGRYPAFIVGQSRSWIVLVALLGAFA